LDGHLERSLAVARHGCSQCSGSDNSIVPVDFTLSVVSGWCKI